MNNPQKDQLEAQQIIQDAYNTKPKFKEQVDYYNLGLENVGVQIYTHNTWGHNAKIGNGYNTDAPIMLAYSMEDNRVVMQTVSLIHPLIEAHARTIRQRVIG